MKVSIKHSLRLIIIIPIMFLLSWYVARYTEQDMRNELLNQTVFGANSVDIEQFKLLKGTLADLKSPAYLQLKHQFARMLKSDSDFHFIYIMGLNPKGKVFFYVDDRPDGTKECSPPGSIYDEAPNEFKKVLKTGIPVVEGPSADSWGAYTSGCAPVIDPETGKVIAIFAIDFNANNWYWEVFSRTALPVGLVIVMTFAFISFLISFQRGKLLRESEKKYQVMFNESPDPYLILNNGIISDCNEVTAISLACLRAEIIGASPYSFFPELQQDGSLSRDIAPEKRDEALTRGKHSFEWILRRKDGTEFWAIMSMSSMILNDQTVIFVTWKDVSEKKKAEQELIKALDAANAASKAKSEFLANMSHEIRTPLNGVIGFTDLLKNTALNPLQEQYAKNANTSGLTLLGIINDILDFSKIEAGMMELEIKKTDLIELLNQSIDIVKLAATQKQLEILLSVDPELPRFAEVDPVRVKQILSNLLGNAVKFTENGEVELEVKYEKIRENEGKIHFSVRDTGIGIKPEDQTKLFKAFSQADSSTTRKFGGTGLGLIISEMIAAKMDSAIKMSSVVGEGSVFSFELKAKTVHGEKPDTSAMQSIKRCLVIDDNKFNRQILVQMLVNWGIESQSCENGQQALEIITSSESFDVIICDYHMPELDGLETIQRIRNRTEQTVKQSVILLLSSSDNADLYKKCDEIDVKYRLTKPVKSDELYSYLCSISQPVEKPEVSVKNSQNIPIVPQFDEPVSILIAEDNVFNMLLIKAIIAKMFANVKIIEAKNGNEALMLWVIEQPELILMDVQMPEMGGVEATIRIRKQETEGHHTPIIALTAGALTEEREQCLTAGMDDFLTKPIDPNKLKETILRIFNWAHNKHKES